MADRKPIEDYYGTKITAEPVFKSSGLFIYVDRVPIAEMDGGVSMDRLTPEQARELAARLIEAAEAKR